MILLDKQSYTVKHLMRSPQDTKGKSQLMILINHRYLCLVSGYNIKYSGLCTAFFLGISVRFKFSLPALLSATVLFITLVVLATYGADLGWIRGFLGDVIAVIFVYACLRIIIECNRLWLVAAAFMTGATLELGQYLAKLYEVSIANPVLRIMLGATPDWLDILAYGCGALAIVAYLMLEHVFLTSRK